MQREITQFRCPFESKGRESRAILEVSLGEDKMARLGAARKAFVDLHADQKKMAIRFTLPPSVLAACSSIHELHAALVPYQAELVAAELDYRLDPLLPYQVVRSDKAKVMLAVTTNQSKALAAAAFMQVIGEMKFPMPKTMGELSVLLEVIFQQYMKKGQKNPTIHFLADAPNGTQIPVLSIIPAGIILHFDRKHLADRASNKNCFAIVKCPFYPRGFGRWSEQVEIVYSREADFAGIDGAKRKEIRADANWILQQHGVAIESLEDDKQNIGLWIPGEDIGP